MLLPQLALLALLLTSSDGCSSDQSQPAGAAEKAPLNRLHIDLQEGFAGESVIVKVNQAEVFNRPNVGTKALFGYADTFDVAVPSGPTKIEIVLPTSKLSQTIELPVSKTTYVGISLQDGRIEYLTSEEPFGYA